MRPSKPAFWFLKVLHEHAKAERHLSVIGIHDLRTALRRSLVFSKTFRRLAQEAKWEELRREARRLFKGLELLRNSHVLIRWCRILFPKQNKYRMLLLKELLREERIGKAEALRALRQFDRKRWARLSAELEKHMGEIASEGSQPFLKKAYRQLTKTIKLHQEALGDSSDRSYHKTRIALKHFRYTVENFLPLHHRRWGRDLKSLQDLLGEHHDLAILEEKLKLIVGEKDSDHSQMIRRIKAEKKKRMDAYLRKTTGGRSLYKIWKKAF